MKLVGKSFVFISIVSLLALSTAPAAADHSWGGYHWARTSTAPVALTLGDNLTSQWDPYLVTATADWAQSSVLAPSIVTGGVPAKKIKQCVPADGKIEVCNSKYGFNGWLGIAGIYLSGNHITRAYTKLNDSYFNTSTYNTPAWRSMVVCQEVAHDFGLDHQDEIFDNPNLGSCMDYTSDPDGPPSNEHPNGHDYDQLETIYNTDPSTGGHIDSTAAAGPRGRGANGGRSRVVDVDEHGNGTITWTLWIH